MTRPTLKWMLTALLVAAALAAMAAAVALIDARSQAVLDARHARPPSAVRALASPDAIAAGAHLVAVTACAGCHGADLTGRWRAVSGSPIHAPNLTIQARRLSDGDLDRAIRRGLRPDGRTELAMPSQAYAGFTDDEVGAIIGYLRSQRPRGKTAAQPRPGLMLRVNLLAGAYRTIAARLADARAPLDAGPRYALGRHLARVACGQCHGGDLGGDVGPDLSIRGDYDRAQFHVLMRTGAADDGRDLMLMSRTAKASFSHFSDGEIDAIFDYLQARDRILGARRSPAQLGQSSLPPGGGRGRERG